MGRSGGCSKALEQSLNLHGLQGTKKLSWGAFITFVLRCTTLCCSRLLSSGEAVRQLDSSPIPLRLPTHVRLQFKIPRALNSNKCQKALQKPSSNPFRYLRPIDCHFKNCQSQFTSNLQIEVPFPP